MLNIVVINCNDNYVEYEWNSLKDFVSDIDSDNENDFSKVCTKKIRKNLLDLGYNSVSWTDDKGKKLALLKPELIIGFAEV